MKKYPGIATHRFDSATFNIKYLLYLCKKHITGKVLDVGAGCGSFTKIYSNFNISSITLTEVDKENFYNLKKNFKKKNVKVFNCKIKKIKDTFDTIMYFHVLEHIYDDFEELKEVNKRLKPNGKLIIVVPAHQKIYGKLDKEVGHYRRYEKQFFKKEIYSLRRVNIKFVDSIGYILYILNNIFFREEKFPSIYKIFIWDKIFIPISMLTDYFLKYKFGKCIVAIYQKK